MPYFAQGAPPNIQNIDELRQWAEEEFRKIATHVADVEGPWLAYTPSLSVDVGSLTSASAVGRYKQIGKTVSVEAVVTITTVGTASSWLNVSLPPIGVAKADYTFVVSETNVVAFMGFGRVAAGASVVKILRYDNAVYMGNGYRLVLSGTYELA